MTRTRVRSGNGCHSQFGCRVFWRWTGVRVAILVLMATPWIATPLPAQSRTTSPKSSAKSSKSTPASSKTATPTTKAAAKTGAAKTGASKTGATKSAAAPGKAGKPAASGPLRWAILGDSKVIETGLLDLVLVKLGALDGIELVERQELAKVAGEQKLSQLFSPDQPGERLAVGQLLKAQRLVLVSQQEFSGSQYVRIIIADTDGGARLAVESRKLVPEEIEETADWCSERVAATQRKFAAGIRALVALTAFVNRDQSHTYDHLQAALPGLIEGVLLGRDGVAVLAIAEARAIQQELVVTGGELRTRAVPVIVEGEFESTDRSEPENPKLKLSIRLRAGARPEEFAYQDELNKLQPILIEDLAGKLLKTTQAGARFNPNQLHDALIARALEFAPLEAYEQSLSLTEAALLLRPRDLETRLFLLEQYALQMARFRKSPPSEELSATALDSLNVQAHHTEWLVRNKQVNGYQTLKLLSRMLEAIPYGWDRERPEVIDWAEEFLWNVLPVAADLDPEINAGSIRISSALWDGASPPVPVPAFVQERDRWHREVSDLTYYRYPPRANKSATLESPALLRRSWGATWRSLQRQTLELTPAERPQPALIGEFMLRGVGQSNTVRGSALAKALTDGVLKPEELTVWLEELQSSKRPACQFYGRLGKLGLQLHLAEAGKLPETSLSESDQLAALAQTLIAAPGEFEARRTADLFRDFRDALGRKAGTVSAKPKTYPIDLNYESRTPPDDPERRIRFDVVASEIAPGWVRVIPCGPFGDAFHYADRVLLADPEDRQKILYRTEPGKSPNSYASYVLQVVFDGVHLWVSDSHKGVFVFRPDGQEVSHFPIVLDGDSSAPGPLTLPAVQPAPAGHPQTEFRRTNRTWPWSALHMRLYLIPTRAGSCLAIGRTTAEQRLWFARLHVGPDGKSPRYEVIHQASKAFATSSAPDPALIFNVSSWCEFGTANPDGDGILFSRLRGFPERKRSQQMGGMASERTWSVHPLAIGRENNVAEVLPLKFENEFGDQFDLAVHKGDLFTVGDRGIVRLARPEEAGQAWNATVLQARQVISRIPQIAQWLRFGDTMYVPGPVWTQLAADGRSVQILNQTPLPRRYWFEWYAVSARYGLVAWNTNEPLYQISFPSEAFVQSPAENYPFIPADAVVRHAKASEELQRLGARVGEFRLDQQVGHVPAWATGVCLGKGWRGTDEDLARLQDLWNVQLVSIVQAPVGDQALEYVGQLDKLVGLELIETRCTDKGIEHLAELRTLQELHLEGVDAGDDFSDTAVGELVKLPKLFHLVLYGRRFTDESIQNLKKMPALRLLTLLQTSVNNSAKEDLKRSARSIGFWEHRQAPHFLGLYR